jgi:uncharacterized membrane protein YfcA
MLDPSLIFFLAALGLFSGFMAGLLGIGGGMVMSPFLTLLLSQRGLSTDLAVKMSIATAMSTIVFTSLSSVRAHHQRGAVHWNLVQRIAPGIVLGGALASIGVFTLLKGNVLAIFFAVLVCFSATQMLLNKKPQPSRQMPGTVGQSAAGTVIGFVSGLVGAGGGFISVPFMVAHNVPMLQAVATSAALGFPIALSNTVGFVVSGSSVNGLPPYSLGFVWLPALAIIATCSVLTAPLGARTAHKLPVQQLKRAFAIMLYLLAGYMLYKGL